MAAWVGAFWYLPCTPVADEFLAFELAKLHAGLETAIEWHADRPRTRVHVRVLDRSLIRKVIRSNPANTLHHVQAVGVVVASAVQESNLNRPFLIESGDGAAHEAAAVDHECVALPSTVRPSHPCVGWWRALAAHVNGAMRAGELRHHENRRVRLYDLHRVGHVHHSRDTGQVALDLRVFSKGVGRILLLLCEGVGAIRNRSVHHDALSRQGPRKRHPVATPVRALPYAVRDPNVPC